MKRSCELAGWTWARSCNGSQIGCSGLATATNNPVSAGEDEGKGPAVVRPPLAQHDQAGGQGGGQQHVEAPRTRSSVSVVEPAVRSGSRGRARGQETDPSEQVSPLPTPCLTASVRPTAMPMTVPTMKSMKPASPSVRAGCGATLSRARGCRRATGWATRRTGSPRTRARRKRPGSFAARLGLRSGGSRTPEPGDREQTRGRQNRMMSWTVT